MMPEDLRQQVRDRWSSILDNYAQAVQDGRLDRSEVMRISTLAVGSIAYLLLTVVPETSPVQRREFAMLLAQDFYVKILEPLDIPEVPTVVERTVIDPLLRSIFPKIVGSLYDAISQLMVELLSNPQTPSPDFFVLTENFQALNFNKP